MPSPAKSTLHQKIRFAIPAFGIIAVVILLPGLIRKRVSNAASAQAGFQISTFAEQPLLSHPVAIALDSRNRVYVVETNKFELENLDGYREQLACQTIEDAARFSKLKRGQKPERIHLIVDEDNDGVADHSKIFADEFDVADGIAAGILVHDGDVYFGNSPHLWRLQDTTGNNKANQRNKIHSGFGVRPKLKGHDLHGLIMGPDGRLYFSMGDRGLHVKTSTGTVAVTDAGCVLRCEPDGTNLEVFATGLRNAQELAFDAYGNLWTCDNNANRGDKSRWVYVVEGGDSGWRAAFQTLDRLGPFTDEKIWDADASVPFRIPSVGHASEGPAGLAFYPGTGFPTSFNNSFLLCDYMGEVLSVRVEPQGAGFKLSEVKTFASVSAPTDVAFGADGAVYVSDWVDTFQTHGQGRILRIQHRATSQSVIVRNTKRILRAGMEHRHTSELTTLLSHADMRVRQNAQFELTDRGAAVLGEVSRVLAADSSQMARIHAIRILGALPDQPAAADAICFALSDTDSEIRAQAAREIGDRQLPGSDRKLVECLRDPSARVRYFAAISLGKLGVRDSLDPLLQLASQVENDAFLRHAVVMGLAGVADESSLANSPNNETAATRLAIVLALRRLKSQRVADFLLDEDPIVVLAAARAIHDTPIESATGALANLIDLDGHVGKSKLSDLVVRRSINANFRLGGSARANRIAAIAADAKHSNAIRLTAINALSDWSAATDYDRIMGSYRPIPARDDNDSAVALAKVLPALIASPQGDIAATAIECAGKLNIAASKTELFGRVKNERLAPAVRARALQRLAEKPDSDVIKAIQTATKSQVVELRRAAVGCLPKVEHSTRRLSDIARQDASHLVRQTAILALGQIEDSEADSSIVSLLASAGNGGLSPTEFLELIEVAEMRTSSQVQTELNAFKTSGTSGKASSIFEVLHGGDRSSGEDIFHNSLAGQCHRCHTLEQRQGKAGPSLASVGRRLNRNDILQSILVPNAKIAKGFERSTLVLNNGTLWEGLIEHEDTRSVTIRTSAGKVRVIETADIEDRSKPTSAMPQNFAQVLTRREIRDLVEFLSSQVTSSDHMTSLSDESIE